MANAAKLAQRTPVRELLVSYPGGGKTGSIASLANAGYKIRLLDFDGNTEPLLRFTKPEFLSNIDILSFRDKMGMTGKTFEPVGVPTAFKNALAAMDEWKYKEDDDTEVNLGKSKDWGCDTVVVLDSLTSMGVAAMRRIQNMMNKTSTNTTQQVWGVAQKEQEGFIEKLTSPDNRFHVIVLAHLKMIGPKDTLQGDSDLTKDLKEKAADIIPTRLFPNALGQALSPLIGGHFPTLLLAEAKYLPGNRAVRYIKTVTRSDLDLKVPATLDQIPAELEISTAQAEIFKVLAPPLAECKKGVATPQSTGA